MVTGLFTAQTVLPLQQKGRSQMLVCNRALQTCVLKWHRRLPLSLSMDGEVANNKNKRQLRRTKYLSAGSEILLDRSPTRTGPTVNPTALFSSLMMIVLMRAFISSADDAP